MDTGRTIAITDIHGELEKLDSLLGKLEITPQDKIVFLGDYIDRGAFSREVVDRIIGLSDICECIYLMGSHEYAYLHARQGDEYYKYLFWNYGGVQTVQSYGSFDNIHKIHGEFFEHLKPYYETDKLFFIHAGLRPGIPLEKQAEEDFYYIRGEFIYNKTHFPKKIIFGHTEFDSPLVQDDKICIDTGCGKYPDAVLTAIICDSEEFVHS